MHKYIVICKMENCYKGIEYMGEESFCVVIVVIIFMECCDLYWP